MGGRVLTYFREFGAFIDPYRTGPTGKFAVGATKQARRISELEHSLEECRAALMMAQNQLVAAESRLEEERSRNDLLSARLKRETLRCIDPHNWGLEPGVGL